MWRVVLLQFYCMLLLWHLLTCFRETPHLPYHTPVRVHVLEGLRVWQITVRIRATNRTIRVPGGGRGSSMAGRDYGGPTGDENGKKHRRRRVKRCRDSIASCIVGRRDTSHACQVQLRALPIRAHRSEVVERTCEDAASFWILIIFIGLLAVLIDRLRQLKLFSFIVFTYLNLLSLARIVLLLVLCGK